MGLLTDPVDAGVARELGRGRRSGGPTRAARRAASGLEAQLVIGLTHASAPAARGPGQLPSSVSLRRCAPSLEGSGAVTAALLPLGQDFGDGHPRVRR